MRDWNRRRQSEAGLTLLEVIISLVILGLGMVVALNLFPTGVETSVRVEDRTRARILAESMLASFETDASSFPSVISLDVTSPTNIIPLPGDGYDNDGDYEIAAADINRNGIPDADFDGTPEEPPLNGGVDKDFDGMNGDNGDSNTYPPGIAPTNPVDGDIFYDPEPFIDEEYCDGIDNDGDGLTDEDCRLASLNVQGAGILYDPLAPGDGYDNDGDGEANSPEVTVLDFFGNEVTYKIADGIDNNGDGVIDEGIDEEIFDNVDNDGDGQIDEDTKQAFYPRVPQQFEAPNDKYFWQVIVGRVPDYGGNGIDDDFDGLTDEEILDGLDFDFAGFTGGPDGLVDEDTRVAPMRGFRLITVRITWGGDGIDNDGDGRIDEERPDGVDDDGDGIQDDINGDEETRDTWEFSYEMSGVIEIRQKV